MPALNRIIERVAGLSLKGRTALALCALLAAQGLALLAFEGYFLAKAAQDISAPGYSYNTMLAREVDLEFLTICQAQLPQDARVLDLVDVNAARPYYASIEYYLYPRTTITLDRRDRSDDSIARQIAKFHITHVVLWDPTAYQDSLLLHNTQFFEILDYGRGRMILVVKSVPPRTGS